jgi:hypothetical protein
MRLLRVRPAPGYLSRLRKLIQGAAHREAMATSDFIEIFPKVLGSSTCQALIQIFENSPATYSDTVVSRSGEGVSQDMRKSEGLHLSAENCGEHFAAFDAACKKAYSSYLEKYPNLRRHPATNEQYKIVCYNDRTEHYSWHTDGTAAGVRYRFVSVVAYLNTVKRGGQTEFKYQERSVKPQEGAICCFPSAWPWMHRGLPPQKGKKYIVTAWLRFADLPPM